jgi:hypothetical protein
MKRSPIKRRPKRMSTAEREAKAHFRETVLSSPCLFAQTRHNHDCDGPLDPHHVLRQSYLRTHFSTFGDAKWERVHDPQNGVPLCRAAHDAITTRADWIMKHELPARVVDFAEDWGLGWLLEREVPSLASSARELPSGEENG